MLNRAGVLMPARLGGERSWSDLEETIDFALQSLAPQAVSAGPARFEIVDDAAGGQRWRLTTAAGRIVATSADTYRSSRAARTAVERLRAEPGRITVTPEAGTYRWHVVADNGRTLAASSEAFATRHEAERVARRARDLIASAAPPADARQPSP
jgi:uncharacterized protein YegP (UPF0339 family)